MSETIATLRVPISGDPKQLDAALARAEKRLQAFERRYGAVGRNTPRALPDSGGGGGRGADPATGQARAVQALAQATARLQAAQGDSAAAAATLRGALAGVNSESIQGVRIRTQLAGVEKRVAAEAAGTKSALQQLQGTAAGLGSALGALGFAGGVAALGSFAVEAGRTAIELERTEAVMRQLSGSQARYAAIVKLAQGNQQLFGGSLNSNLQPLNALLQLSNRTGAELQNLNNISQLLLASSPGKAFSDASFSLSEFLSNNGAEAALSLADQFNLNKQALSALAAEGTTAEQRLAGLQAILAEQGVTSETLTASLTDNARAYNALGAEIETLTTSAGSGIADAFSEAATGLSRLLGLVNGNPEALAQLRALMSGGTVDQAGIDQAASDIAATRARGSLRSTERGPGGGPVESRASNELGAEGLADATARSAALIQTSEAAAAAVLALNAALRAGDVDGATYETRLQLIERQYGLLDTSAQSQAAATTAISAATARLATDFQVGAVGAATLDQRMQALIGTGEANALTVAANAQAFADGEISAAQLEGTIAALEAAQRAAAAAAAEQAGGAQVAAASMDLATLAAQAEQQALAAATQAAFDQANAGADLEAQARAAAEALLAAGGAGAGAAAQLAGSSNQVDVLTAAYYRLIAAQQAAGAGTGALGNLGERVGAGAGAATTGLRARIASVRQFGGVPLGTRAGRGGGTGSGRSGGGADPAKKAAEQEQREAQQLFEKLRGIEDRYFDASTEAEQQYQDRRLAIQEEFAAKRADAEASFGDQQVENRLGFYKSLKSIDDAAIRAAASAEFEAFATKAAELRDTKGADVAAQYEAEAAQIAAARAKRAEEIKKAAADKEGDLQFLKDLDQMERDAEQRRLDKAAEGKDSLKDQEAGAGAEAEQQRQARLAEAAITAGDALSEAQRKSGEQATITNAQLQDQIALLDQIRQRGGVPAVPAAAPGTAPTAAPAAAPSAAPAAAPGGLPAATGGGPVEVRDAGLDAVRRALDDLSSAVRALRSTRNYRDGA